MSKFSNVSNVCHFCERYLLLLYIKFNLSLLCLKICKGWLERLYRCNMKTAFVPCILFYSRHYTSENAEVEKLKLDKWPRTIFRKQQLFTRLRRLRIAGWPTTRFWFSDRLPQAILKYLAIHTTHRAAAVSELNMALHNNQEQWKCMLCF